ncbi:unnamed protein product, partial [Iphiclides podalirius]
MRSPGKIALCLFLFAGLTARSEAAIPLSLDSGENLETSILTFDDNVIGCYLETPRGETIEFKPNDHSDAKYQLRPDAPLVSACQVTVRNVDGNDSGLWTLRSVSDTDNNLSQSYQVTVNSAETVTEIASTEDITTEETIKESTKNIITIPTEPTEETTGIEELTTVSSVETTTPKLEDVTIIDMEPGYFTTRIGEVHTVKILEYDFLDTEKCSLVTPDGERHDLDELDIYGIAAIKDQNVACGIKIHVVSEDLAGNWMLISRSTRFSTEIVEKRMPVTIILEEIVNAIPSEIAVVEGNDIYIRLEASTPFYESCKLIDPANNERVDIEKDARHIDTCGFILRNATQKDSGYWHIAYGVKTNYKAWTLLIIHGLNNTELPSHYTWTMDRPVEQLIGSDNTVYCRVLDANDNVVFDGFGKCNISLARVSTEHAGTWKMFVGSEGRMLTEEHKFEVAVREGASKPAVSTSIATEKPIVTLTCSVSSPEPVRACKFRDPSGRVLLAAPGVGEGRYAFHGNGASYSSGVHGYECGLQITEPVIGDLGLWRCALETETETYYGFLTALCPWAMRDPEVAAMVQSEPLLQAESELVNGVTGTPVTMSCSVQSPIRYCYFRARNGTTFSVSPGESTAFVEYAGAGFDAGECSVRFSNLLPSDGGLWSCHVGFSDPTEPEQRAQFEVSVQELLTAEQREEKNAVIVTGRVHDNRPLEYCRFVRIDGLGFTTENLPEGYRSDSLLSVGRCEIRIPNPSVLELHPWTVAVRVRGHDVEYSQQTLHSLQAPPTDPERPVGPVYRFPLAWVVVIVVGLSLVVVGALAGPRRHRQWTATRAARLRDSFRHSFGGKVPGGASAEKTSPIAA